MLDKFKLALLAGATATALASAAVPAQAGEFHVFGNKIYYTGSTRYDDGERLAAFYRQLTAQGRRIDTVVFRTAPGGYANGGLGMADFIRTNRLNTVFQGGCYSACAIAFSGGVQRGMARFDLPWAGISYGQNALGFHGGSVGGSVASDEINLGLYEFVTDLLEPQLTDDGRLRIRQAHLELRDSQGFLRYLDPNTTTDGTNTIWCPTGAWQGGTTTSCTRFASSVTAYSDGVLTTPGYVTLEDNILIQNRTVTGAINPGYAYDLSTADTYSMIKIGEGGVWNFDRGFSGAQITWITSGGVLNLGANSEMSGLGLMLVMRGGRLNLDGGMYSVQNRLYFQDFGIGFLVPANYAGRAELYGTISGSGRLGKGLTFQSGSRLEAEHIRLVPYANPNRQDHVYDFSTVTSFLDGSTLAVKLRNTKTTPYVDVVTATYLRSSTFEEARNFLYQRGHQTITLGLKTNLELSFQPGFFRPGQKLQIIGQSTDPTLPGLPAECANPALATCTRLTPERLLQPTTAGFPGMVLNGQFATITRASDGRVFTAVIDGRSVMNIPVSDDSLLSFDLVYTPMTNWAAFFPSRPVFFSDLSLIAKPAFDDTSLFANAASGDGLGRALLATSNKEAPGNAELLGALQFSTRSMVRNQSGNLRGDAYVTQTLNDLGFLNLLNGQGSSRIQARRDGTSTVTPAVVADLVSGMDVEDRSGSGAMAMAGGDMLRFLVDGPPQADGGPGGTGSRLEGWQAWGQFLSGRSEVQADLGVRALDSTYAGVTLGADHKTKDRLILGGSVTYATGEAETAAKAYTDQSDILSGAVYGGLTYGRGAIDGSVRYTDIQHESTRTVSGIAGLAPTAGDYGSTALSAHVEHTVDFKNLRGKGTDLKLIVPSLDYLSLETDRIAETGGVGRLTTDVDTLESLRVGTGIELSRRIVSPEGGTVQPYVRLSYQRELGDVNATAQAFMLGEATSRFAVNSQEVGEDIGQVRIGLTAHHTDRWAIAAHYQGEFRTNQEQHGGFVGLSYRF